jgi:RNA recognition motif-containing protein
MLLGDRTTVIVGQAKEVRSIALKDIRKQRNMYKLYVGGLPFSTTDEELSELFGAHGKVVSAKVITDRETGRSKGFGFVEFENDAEGKAAEAAMNGSDVGGRSINVNEARPMQPREPRRDFGGGGGGNRSW